MATIIATPAAASANSYLTLAEAEAYFGTRVALSGWEDAEDKSVLLIMATRTLDKIMTPLKTLFVQNGVNYYRVRPQWTGAATTATQRLAWPRTGMYDANENVIDSMVIPEDLKFAVAEFAGQLGVADRTLDSDVVVQGISSLKAGSVALSFRDGIVPQVLPDAVYNLLVNSWMTEELYEPAQKAMFNIIGSDTNSNFL